MKRTIAFGLIFLVLLTSTEGFACEANVSMWGDCPVVLTFEKSNDVQQDSPETIKLSFSEETRTDADLISEKVPLYRIPRIHTKQTSLRRPQFFCSTLSVRLFLEFGALII